MTRARPLRFLALVLGLWIGARAAMLVLPGTPARIAPVANGHPGTHPPGGRRSQPPPDSAALRQSSFPSPIREFPYQAIVASPTLAAPVFSVTAPAPSAAPGSTGEAYSAANPLEHRVIPAIGGGPDGMQEFHTPPRAASPWSASAWLLARDGRGQAALAPGGTLGGSQAGARLLYQVDGRLALSGRVSIPLRRTRGAELAAGIDWQPVARLPVHLLAERRQDLGGEGRSAFALTLYGGASGTLPGGLRGEVYAQAGVVGRRSRDLFVDGVARVERPVGRGIGAGGGLWGAAQPGAARLDAGPSLSWRPALPGTNLRLQADWRFRVAGDAAPGSGPALTVALAY